MTVNISKLKAAEERCEELEDAMQTTKDYLEAYWNEQEEGFQEHYDPNYVRITENLFEEWKDCQYVIASELSALGAAYLDENYPRWREQVSAERLSMSSGDRCILGQAFGDYDAGINEIFLRECNKQGVNPNDTFDTRNELGKSMGFLENGACYMALDLAWQDRL